MNCFVCSIYFFDKIINHWYKDFFTITINFKKRLCCFVIYMN